MKTLIKVPFKIIAIPFIPVLFSLGMVMTFLSWISGRILTFASLLFGIGGIVLLFQGSMYSGIGIIIIAFFISPFGIPAIASGIADILHNINGSIIGFVTD